MVLEIRKITYAAANDMIEICMYVMQVIEMCMYFMQVIDVCMYVMQKLLF